MPTFYYTLKAKGNKKDDSLRRKIKELYDSEGKGNEKYGYRRICDKLRQTECHNLLDGEKLDLFAKILRLSCKIVLLRKSPNWTCFFLTITY